jgi:hypothetical protein
MHGYDKISATPLMPHLYGQHILLQLTDSDMAKNETRLIEPRLISHSSNLLFCDPKSLHTFNITLIHLDLTCHKHG